MNLSKSPSALFLARLCSYKHTHCWYSSTSIQIWWTSKTWSKGGVSGCCLFAAAGKTNIRTKNSFFWTFAVFNALKGDTGQTRRCACEMGILLILPRPAVHIAVAGADGVGGNARSWAIVAKAGMKQADAPQEKARPRTSPQINDTSRAKGKFIPTRLYTFMCVGSTVTEAVGWRGILLHGGEPHEQFIVMIETKKDGLGVSCFCKTEQADGCVTFPAPSNAGLQKVRRVEVFKYSHRKKTRHGLRCFFFVLFTRCKSCLRLRWFVIRSSRGVVLSPFVTSIRAFPLWSAEHWQPSALMLPAAVWGSPISH